MQLARILAVEPVIGFVLRVLAADAGADHGRDLKRERLVDLNPRVAHRRARRDHGELRKAVDHASALGVEMSVGIETRDLRRDPGGQPLGRYDGDRPDPRTGFDQRRPELLDSRNRPEKRRRSP